MFPLTGLYLHAIIYYILQLSEVEETKGASYKLADENSQLKEELKVSGEEKTTLDKELKDLKLEKSGKRLSIIADQDS